MFGWHHMIPISESVNLVVKLFDLTVPKNALTLKTVGFQITGPRKGSQQHTFLAWKTHAANFALSPKLIDSPNISLISLDN